MKNASRSRLFTAATALAALLLLAPLTPGEAHSKGGVKSASAAAAADGYRPRPVVRDHRRNPRPYSLPPHYHRHDRRH